MKKVFAAIIIIGFLANGCAIHSQYSPGQREFKFRFAKRLIFNTYHLRIVNKSEKRAIGFYFSNGENYHVLLKNGARIPFDSKIFYYLGAKGAYLVYPGRSGTIPFEISKSAMRQAKRIVIKGQSYIPRRKAGFLHRDEIRNIIVVVDIADRRITISEGKTRQDLPARDIEDYFSLGETLPDENSFDIKIRKERPEGIEGILRSVKEAFPFFKEE